MGVKNRPNISIEFLRFIIGPTAPRNTTGFMGMALCQHLDLHVAHSARGMHPKAWGNTAGFMHIGRALN
jgi:hypothetical protein